MRTRCRSGWLVAAGVLSLASCGPSHNSGIGTALADYRAGRYAEAHESAGRVALQTRGTERAEAAYVAGMAAYRLGRYHEAKSQFEIAATSTDSVVAGKATFMDGQVLARQQRHREAADRFALAAAVLTGEESRRAALSASEAYARAGDATNARRWRTEAGGGARRVAAVTSPTASVPDGAAFVLQVGAFQDAARARRAASDVETVSRGKGYGAPRVIPWVDDRGRRFYLVQFGWFNSRAAASHARSRMGRLDFIVASVDPSA